MGSWKGGSTASRFLKSSCKQEKIFQARIIAEISVENVNQEHNSDCALTHLYSFVALSSTPFFEIRQPATGYIVPYEVHWALLNLTKDVYHENAECITLSDGHDGADYELAVGTHSSKEASLVVAGAGFRVRLQ